MIMCAGDIFSCHAVDNPDLVSEKVYHSRDVPLECSVVDHPHGVIQDLCRNFRSCL